MTAPETEKHARLDSLLPSAEMPLRAEMFVHSLAPVGDRGRQERLIDDLEGLQDSGALTDVGLTVWGDSICTEGTLSTVGSGSRIVGAISDFFALAADAEISISPFYRISNVHSSITGESFRRIVPPSRCIAVYATEELVAVFPSLVDGVAYTPEDFVEYMKTTVSASVRTGSVADE